MTHAWFAADLAWAAGEAGVFRMAGMTGAKMFLVIVSFAFLGGIAKDAFSRRDDSLIHAPEKRPPLTLTLCPRPKETEHTIVFSCPIPFPSSDK
jgi:hypothetical protein